MEQEKFVGEVGRQRLDLGYELVQGGEGVRRRRGAFERTIPRAFDIFFLGGDGRLQMWWHRE